ncbi:MAG TPA: hypothetical protein VGL12_01005 [Roseiarcus sp.]
MLQNRALAYVGAGDLRQAVAGMASDLKTHPDTDNPSLNGLAMIGMMYVTDGDKAAVALDRTFSMTEAERPLALGPRATAT